MPLSAAKTFHRRFQLCLAGLLSLAGLGLGVWTMLRAGGIDSRGAFGLLAALVGLLGLWRAIRVRDAAKRLDWTGVRLLLYGTLFGYIGLALVYDSLLGSDDLRYAGLAGALLGGLGIAAGANPIDAAGLAKRPKLAALESFLCATSITLVCLTWFTHLASEYIPSKFFQNFGDPGQNIARFKLKPGSRYLGHDINTLGFNDEEPPPPQDAAKAVGIVGDSFVLGITPRPYNFVSVAANRTGLRLVNFGVAGTGPEEYLRLLETDVRAVGVGQAAVVLYVGNDLYDARLAANPRRLTDLRLFQILRRVWSSYSAMRSGASSLVGRVINPEFQEMANPPWLFHPELEPPTIPEDVYRRYIRASAPPLFIGDAEMDRQYARLFRTLTAMRKAAPKGFGIVLAPADFQLDEALLTDAFAEVAAKPRLDLERPSREIGGWCDREGVPFLDLLPVFRSANRGPLHHLRDSHFNAMGNRVAGEAIADWLMREKRLNSPNTRTPAP